MEGVRLLYSEEGEGKEEDAGGMWATLSRYRLVWLQNVYIFVKLPLGFHAARPPQFLYYQSTATCTKRPGSPLNTQTCPLLYIHIVMHLTDFSASYTVDEILCVPMASRRECPSYVCGHVWLDPGPACACVRWRTIFTTRVYFRGTWPVLKSVKFCTTFLLYSTYIDVHRNVLTFRSVSVLISFASIHYVLRSTMGLWCILALHTNIMCTSVLSYSLPMAHYTDPLLLYICCSSVYFLMCTYVYVSLMGGGEEGQKKESTFGKNETINVFSIASGHLYERFLRYIHT